METQTQEKSQVKEYKVAVLTPYLTQGIDSFKCPMEFIEQLSFGYDPFNLSGLKFLQTSKKNIVTIKSAQYDGTWRCKTMFENVKDSDLIISGSTEAGEEEVRSFKGSGLVVARFSIFYGGNSDYTGSSPESAGYSLDLPKSVGCAVALLTNDNCLEAIASREEVKVRAAIAELNKGHEQAPVLITPYLAEALKTLRGG
jgi:hypothetical protein